jgi:hypothetical protein
MVGAVLNVAVRIVVQVPDDRFKVQRASDHVES